MVPYSEVNKVLPKELTARPPAAHKEGEQVRKVSGAERSEGNLFPCREPSMRHVSSTSDSSAHPWKLPTSLLPSTEKRTVCWTPEAIPALACGLPAHIFVMHCTTSQGLNETLHPPPEHFQMTWNNPTPWSPVLLIGTLWIKQTPRKKHTSDTCAETASLYVCLLVP